MKEKKFSFGRVEFDVPAKKHTGHVLLESGNMGVKLEKEVRAKDKDLFS